VEINKALSQHKLFLYNGKMIKNPPPFCCQSQILRGKLQAAEKELERQRQEKHREVESIKQNLEYKIKELERQLERTQVQMLFKV
jgi:hypothetical protein